MTSRWTLFTFALLTTMLILSGCQHQAAAPPQSGTSIVHTPTAPTPAPDPVKELLKEMTLAQKLGQMVMAGIDGTVMDEQKTRLIKERYIGGFILYKPNMSGVEQTTALLNGLKAANSSNRLPLLLSVDQEGGTVSRLPAPVAAPPASRQIGRTGSANQAKAVGSAIGTQLAAFGFNMDFAPVLDVDSNPANPVIGSRSFGSTAALVEELGVQTMLGLRSQGVIPVVKHFPGHGDTTVDSHLELPTVSKSLEQLRQLELLPFSAAIQSGSDAVMVAHILLPRLDQDYPASMSAAVINRLLREELGFGGVVITDDMTMGAIAKHYELGQASVQSVLAGTDIVLVAHGEDQVTVVLDALEQAVVSGLLPVSRVDESVYRIISMKKGFRLTDTPAPPVGVEAINTVMKQAAGH